MRQFVESAKILKDHVGSIDYRFYDFRSLSIICICSICNGFYVVIGPYWNKSKESIQIIKDPGKSFESAQILPKGVEL
jgi:hypothetical protein